MPMQLVSCRRLTRTRICRLLEPRPDVGARWPRTGALLREFARTYERHAAREDLHAALRHDLMG